MLASPRILFPALALLLLAGCSDDDPTGPGDQGPDALTVDASETWAFVSLDGDGATPVQVGEPRSSDAWDLGFFATSVMLNGGAAGPAEVVGHCVCSNQGAPDAAVVAMTPESELPAFEAVTEASIPEDGDAWSSDALAPAIDGWWSYDPATHVVSAVPGNAWKVRTASGDAFARFHVVGIAGATMEHAGTVTFEYAVQPGAGEPFGATRTGTVDLADGSARFDLESGAAVDDGDAWDLHFDGYAIRVNGGVSGDGSAGASLSDVPFGEITDAGDLDAGHYRGDAFGGVFDAHPWYRYDLEDNHQIWPTFDVYLVKRGDAVYKVQLTGYYDATGDARHVTFRYARLR